jgi:hypothetical protein
MANESHTAGNPAASAEFLVGTGIRQFMGSPRSVICSRMGAKSHNDGQRAGRVLQVFID